MFRLLVLGLFLGTLWFILCRQLSNEWSANEQYSYGWFVPFFAAFLFWLRWEKWPAHGGMRSAECGLERGDFVVPSFQSQKRIINNCAAALGALALVLLLPLRVFEKGVPDWRILGWVHAGSVVTVTLLMLWRIGGWRWVWYFAFPVCFIFVAVPWPVYLEGGVTNHLMRIVASIAAETVSLLGIPVQLEGNLLRLATGVVGVDEACSGVRSLQTSIMIGLLFGELNRFDLVRRGSLLAAAVALALSTNVARAVFLVWIASTDGLEAVNRWHDFAGYTIVGVVFVGCLAVVRLLKGGSDLSVNPEVADPRGTSWRALLAVIPGFAIFSALIWLVAVEAGAELWYHSSEADFAQRLRWSVAWPKAAPGLRVLPVAQFRKTLAYDEGSGASWMTGSGAEPGFAIYGYFFRWDPGRVSILKARTHRPDRCLPNAGWQQRQDYGLLVFRVGALALPFRHFEFLRPGVDTQPALHAHAFHYVGPTAVRRALVDHQGPDRTVHAYGDELTALAFRTVIEGERERGQQVLQVTYIGPQVVTAAEAEERFATDLAALVQIAPRP
ncbi:MAG: exosortase/archaeosortase family protein [Chthoniobacterales bacterium]